MSKQDKILSSTIFIKNIELCIIEIFQKKLLY